MEIRQKWAAVTVAVALASTAGLRPAVGGARHAGTSGSPLPVVVADIGSGTNPYHRVFRRPGWTEPPAIPGMPVATPLPLTLGEDYAASREADAAVWNGYRPNTLYWVPGTNLLLLTTRAWPSPNEIPDGKPDQFHTVATSGLVSSECPRCWVLVVQDYGSLDGHPVQRITDEMPWVDVVVSTNTPGPLFDGRQPYAKATRALYDSGRIFFAASGNFAVTGIGPPPQYNVPPWVVPVGGAHRVCHATEPTAGRPAELVAEFSPVKATPESVDGWSRGSGTSFAAPIVAAEYAEALARIRERLGDTRLPGSLWAGTPPTQDGPLGDGVLTQEELRNAFRAAATYFETTDGVAESCVTEDPDAYFHAAPVPVSPTPWVEMGWGYVGDGEGRLATRIAFGEGQVESDPIAETYLAGILTARRMLYGTE